MAKEDYQFPVLSWNRGSVLATTIIHGLYIKREGRWHIPDFQRPLVWTVEQNVRFMESLILGLPIGEYTLHQNDDYTYTVLDGQQRWNAIFEYFDDKFPVFGLYHRDLGHTSINCIELTMLFPHRLVQGLTREQQIDAYERLAYGGTPHAPVNAKRSEHPSDAEAERDR